jgi:hypothetical protein
MEEKKQKPLFNVDFFEDLTGDIPAEPEKGVEDIGQRIRKIRKEKELSRVFCQALRKMKSNPSWVPSSNCPRRWTVLLAG